MEQDRRVRKTQKALKDSLIYLLDTKPINRITVTQLCDLADVNRSSFYKYYTDVENMMENIEDELLEVFWEQVNICMKIPDNGLSQIIQIIYTHRELYRHINHSKGRTRFLNKFFTAVWSDFAEIINIKYSIPENEKEFLYSFITMGYIGIIERWLEHDFKESVQDVTMLCERLSNVLINEYTRGR